MEFFDTPEGQLLAGAHKYLTSAKIICDTPEWQRRTQFFHAPVLHLLCHGLELLLKYPIVCGGASVDTVRQRYGHKLWDLWEAPENAHLRNIALDRSIEAWRDARAKGVWRDDDFKMKPTEGLIEFVQRLAWLHSAESNFALRYIAPPATLAPVPPFLIDVFEWISDRGVMNPKLLLHP